MTQAPETQGSLFSVKTMAAHTVLAPSSSHKLPLRFVFLIRQDAFRSAVKVLILTTLQGPKETDKAECAKKESDRNQVDERYHDRAAEDWALEPSVSEDGRTGLRRTDSCRRNAFAMTNSEEIDIAAAAISGVTWPKIATGTAIAL